MVRSKAAPTQLNEVQQRRVHWNLNDETNYYIENDAAGTHGSGESDTEEDNIRNLINDDSDKDDDDDDEGDVDFIPYRNLGNIEDIVLNSESVDNKQNLCEDVEYNEDIAANVILKANLQKQRRHRGEIENYGDFETILESSLFFGKIYIISDYTPIYPIGEIKLKLFDLFTEDLIKLCNIFWIYINAPNNNSAIYFEWFDKSKSSSTKQANNSFNYYVIDGFLDIELWKGLVREQYFKLVLKNFDQSTKEFTILIEFLESGFPKIKCPSDFVRRKSIIPVVSYFFGIAPLPLPNNSSYKYNVDELYGMLKLRHSEKPLCSADVQHNRLVPQLRPYQKSAVQWMLYMENYGRSVSDTTSKLHPLYIELECLNGKILWYNNYGGTFVCQKPLEKPPTPGGILSDDMGLGKTVEVLACILCHTRKLDTSDKIFNYNSSSLTFDQNRTDTVISTENKLCDTLEEFSCNSSKKLKADHNILEIDDASINLTEDTENKLFSEEEEFNRSGRPKRKASCIKFKFDVSDDEDNSESYYNSRGSEKLNRYNNKKSFVSSSTVKKPKIYNIEDEIANNSVLTLIEKVIVDMCWEGNKNNYKKDGSYKEYRKFLKIRKDDPYYMMTVREHLNLQYQNSIAEFSAVNYINKRNAQKLEIARIRQNMFECVCGENEGNNKPQIQCKICNYWQHTECLNYVGHKSDSYICPHCWTQQEPVKSGATLIVTPPSICCQWVDEIRRHLKKKALQILVYKGVSYHGYIQPQDLAMFDIVLTTYETLSIELNHVGISSGCADDNQKFRFPKRFMALPSPLTCVEWWRICLDEAQMVESSTNKTAEMALRLAAINRWCVTGTPIQKSINDLQGLLYFLGVDPYWVPQWWNQCLFLPFCNGNYDPLVKVLSQYMWRNSKQDVVHQIDIPPQSEVVHWLTFTHIEEHFYQRLHTECAYDARQVLTKYPDETVKLNTLDRQSLSTLLQPLLKLRQACNHPQVVRGQFVSLNRQTMSMEQILENLIQKTKVEAEEAHRVLVSSLNGLSAIHIINEDWDLAVEKYREVLRSVEEHKEKLNTDSLQRLHTLHNLSELLDAGHGKAYPTLRDSNLIEEAEQIKEHYLRQYPARIKEVQEECRLNTDQIKASEKKYNYEHDWWLIALSSFHDNFVEEIRDELLSKYSRFEKQKCILHYVHSKNQLLKLLMNEKRKLQKQRKDMLTAINNLLTLNPNSFLSRAIDCHLRPVVNDPVPCQLCSTHEFFESYEETLFFMKESKHTRTTETAEKTKDIKEKAQVLQTVRKGNWSQSETEIILKYIQTKCLGKIDKGVYEDSHTDLAVFEYKKKEFKNYRILWRAIYDHVSGLDEVNMATLRLRIHVPGDDIIQPVKKKNQEVQMEKTIDAPTYIIDKCDIPQKELSFKSDCIMAKNDLRAKLGQLLYLQNLQKADYGRKGGSNPELCPVCQVKLGEKWAVLECGHSYCVMCTRALISKHCTNQEKNSLNCPMCRSSTKGKNICYVDMEAQKQNEEEQDLCQVQGSLSTKIEGIVRALLKIKADDPEGKVLIFSSWKEVLDLISDALSKNGITHRQLQSSNKFQATLMQFRTKPAITALLLPVLSGSKGLNLTEARYVLLVEPILNPAAESQALGRIHRIGQTKSTFVHRFLVKDTIEERMYKILHPYQIKASAEENAITIADLKNLFKSTEELKLESKLSNSSYEEDLPSVSISGCSNISKEDLSSVSVPSCSNIDECSEYK